MAVTPQQHAQKVMTLLNSGQFAQAAKAAKAALKKFPKEGNFANVAGMALAQMGQPREAISFFAKALKMNPRETGVQDNLLQALILTDQHDKVESMIEKLLDQRSDQSKLYHLWASSFARRGKPDGVVDKASLALDADPANAASLNLRGIALTEMGKNKEALADFERAHHLSPNDADPLMNMGLPLSRMDRHADAIEAVELALSLSPNNVNALHRYAILLTEVGRLDDAIAQYHALLRLDPMHGEAYSELIQTQDHARNLDLEPALTTAISKTPRKAPSQLFLNLGMGNLQFQKGDYQRAGKHLATANGVAAQMRAYDLDEVQKEFDWVTSAFQTGAIDHHAGDTALPRPIFVVGQPRSGTTLSEMMLTAHPSVHSCGELATAGTLALDLMKQERDFDAAEFAAAYRADLPAMEGAPTAFVDKMPANYRFIGPLLNAFPEARIIRIERDPRDVALSVWRSFFPSAGMNYAFDLKAMAFNANLYQRYMAHWQALYGDRILNINYRDIVSDVGAASRSFANFCDLDWTENMASPEKNKARVRTASVVQVRQGVHKKSLGGWRAMEKWLQPFIDGLDPALWPDLD